MLNNEERQRLRAEEIFRQEVRRDIEARVQDRSRRAKFWHALNTPFVLWVLSSIVVGSFGWAFSTFQASRDEKARNLELVRKLDTEIANRIQAALSSLAALEEEIKASNLICDDRFIFEFALGALDSRRAKSNELEVKRLPPGYDIDTGIYPEFRERTFPSLIAELQWAISSSERSQLTRSISAYRTLQVRAGGGGMEPGYVAKRSQEQIAGMLKITKEASELVRTQIKLERWKASG